MILACFADLFTSLGQALRIQTALLAWKRVHLAVCNQSVWERRLEMKRAEWIYA